MFEWILSVLCLCAVLIIYSIVYYILIHRKGNKPIERKMVKISAGPCQFCDWKPGGNDKPFFAYNNDDHTDVILFCPKCGIELIGQTKIED